VKKPAPAPPPRESEGKTVLRTRTRLVLNKTRSGGKRPLASDNLPIDEERRRPKPPPPPWPPPSLSCRQMRSAVIVPQATDA